MIDSARELARVRNPVLLTGAIAWILLLAGPGGTGAVAHCPAPVAGAPPAASIRMLLDMNPPSSLAAGWVLMLAAMMSPVLIEPLYHLRLRSFARRRARSSLLFVAAYAAAWMAPGAALLAIELAVEARAPQSWLPATSAALLALAWQASPVKQRCLNRCHAHPAPAAFGAAADLDALRSGITHGLWCAGSCWALMLVPMLLPLGHSACMAVVALLIFGERLEQPAPPCWRWRGPGKLARMAAARTRIRLRAARFGPPPLSSVAGN